MRLPIFIAKQYLKKNLNYIYWLVVLIDSLLKKDENFYLQVFLRECKYFGKENIVILVRT